MFLFLHLVTEKLPRLVGFIHHLPVILLRPPSRRSPPFREAPQPRGPVPFRSSRVSPPPQGSRSSARAPLSPVPSP